MAFSRHDFDAYYGSTVERWGHPGGRPGIRLGYHWFWVGSPQREGLPVMLEKCLGPLGGAGIVLVGAGFAWTGEGLRDHGAHVVATDISPYILAEQRNTEEAEVREAICAVGLDPDRDTVIGPGNVLVNPLKLFVRGGLDPVSRAAMEVMGEDCVSLASRQSVRRALGVKPRWILTEQTLNSMSDEQGLVFCEAMERLSLETGATVVHMISPKQNSPQAPDLNWKTYPEWRMFLLDNGFSQHRLAGSFINDQNPVAYGAFL